MEQLQYHTTIDVGILALTLSFATPMLMQLNSASYPTRQYLELAPIIRFDPSTFPPLPINFTPQPSLPSSFLHLFTTQLPENVDPARRSPARHLRHRRTRTRIPTPVLERRRCLPTRLRTRLLGFEKPCVVHISTVSGGGPGGEGHVLFHSVSQLGFFWWGLGMINGAK
jgi:hypothetical protein